jgi:hypothetical protein
MSTTFIPSRFILGLCLGLIALTATPAPAHAQEDTYALQKYSGPLDWRRTLFAPFGQKMLSFEVPIGMCFLDESDPVEGLAVKEIRDVMKKKSRQSLVAVFADCLQIAGIGQGGGEIDLADLGLITWLNHHGETFPAGREAYLDLRATNLHQSTQAGLAGYTNPVIDENVHRTANGVTLGFVGDIEIAYQKMKTVGITGTTTLRNFPVEILLTQTAKEPRQTQQELQTIMDKLLAQQVALNAVE